MWGREWVWLVASLGFISLVANVLYMLGGTAGYGLWTRRILASCLLGFGVSFGACVVGRWAWQFLLVTPILFLAMSLGYGGTDPYTKILNRTKFAFFCSLAHLVCLWAIGFTVIGWMVYGLACIGGLLTVFAGVINPWNEATVEQFIISQYLFGILVFWGFVR